MDQGYPTAMMSMPMAMASTTMMPSMTASMMAGAAMSSAAMTSGGAMDMPESTYLTTDGYNLTNSTDLMTFWGALLDDEPFVPQNTIYCAYFWYGMSIVIGLATFVNWSYKLTLRARLRAAAVQRPFPAKPGNLYTKMMAFFTAVVREQSYPQYTSMRFSRIAVAPPTGVILLLTIYFGFLVGLELVQDLYSGAYYYQALGLRAGWLSTAQLPLLVLLVGKQNLITLFTGISHERLNIFHRWVARSIWLFGTLHWAFMQFSWSKYGVAQLEISMDPAYPTGLAAWGVLTWINLSSIGPLRNWQYEFFVIQHILSFMGFIVVIILHLPVQYAKIYVYIPIGLFLFDRLIRGICFAWNNRHLGRATITPLSGDVSRIRIQNTGLRSWSAGTHVFLSLPKFGIFQSHPATIASTPTSHNGDLVFILKAHKGFTARINKAGINGREAAWSTSKESYPASLSSAETGLPQLPKYLALVSGPYGSSHADFACFSSALFIAGGTGVTFTLPLLLNIAERASTLNLPIKHVSFVWILKSSAYTAWVSDELKAAVRRCNKARLSCEVTIFITQDGGLADYNNASGPGTGTGRASSSPDCACADTNGSGLCYCGASRPLPLRVHASTSSKSVGKRGGSVVETHVRPLPSRDASKDAADRSGANLLTVRSGRPNIETIIWNTLEGADGETGVAVCGPLGLGVRVRKAVSGISERRGVHKGTGAQGVYLHVESFGW